VLAEIVGDDENDVRKRYVGLGDRRGEKRNGCRFLLALGLDRKACIAERTEESRDEGESRQRDDASQPHRHSVSRRRSDGTHGMQSPTRHARMGGTSPKKPLTQSSPAA
jgi:hypothetical protein